MRALDALQNAPPGDLPVVWVNNVVRDIRRGVFWGWSGSMFLVVILPALFVWLFLLDATPAPP